MRLTVFGANGPSGRLVVQQALALGFAVRAVTRHPNAFAVISSLGVPYSLKQNKVYSQGTGHVVTAMQHRGIRRRLCVSSSTTYPVDDPQVGFLGNRIFLPLVSNTIGRTTYDDMRRMETLVRGSGLDWTIARPSGLFSGDAITPYQTAENSLGGRFTARADLAASLLARIQDHG